MPFSPNDSVDILIKARTEGQETLKALGGTAAASDASIKALQASIDNLKKSVDTATTAVNDHSKAQRDMASSSTESIAKAILLSGALMKLTSVVKEFTVDAAMYAARTQQMADVMATLAKVNGISTSAVQVLAKDIQALGITTQESYNVINKMITAQLDLRKATDLARLAQDAAKVAGVDSSTALQKIIQGIVQHRSVTLHNLGIQINFNRELARGAAALGLTTRQLTDAQAANILLDSVLRKGAIFDGSYEKSLTTVAGQFQSLKRYTDEAKLAIGEQFEPALSRVVRLLTQSARAAKDNAEEFANWSVHLTAVGAGLMALKLGGGFNPVGITAGLVTAGVVEWLGKTDSAEEAVERTKFALEQLNLRKAQLNRDAQNGDIKYREEYQDQLKRLNKAETDIQEDLTNKLASIFAKRKDKLKEVGPEPTLMEREMGAGAQYDRVSKLAKIPDVYDLGGGLKISRAQIENAIVNPPKVEPFDINKLKATPKDDGFKFPDPRIAQAATAFEGYHYRSLENTADNPITKAIIEYNELIQKHGQYATALMKDQALVDLNARTQKIYNDELKKTQDHFDKEFNKWAGEKNTEFNKAVDDGLKKNADNAKHVLDAMERIRALEASHTDKMMTQEGAYRSNLIRLSARPGDETVAELEAQEVLYQIERQRMQLELNNAKRIGDQWKQAEVLRQIALSDEEHIVKIREDGEIRIAQIRKQEMDKVREDAGKIFDAITASGKDGLTNFFSTEMKGVERQLFVNASSLLFERRGGLGLGNIIGGQRDASGHLTTIGRLLQGTPFATTSDPLTKNTERTANATEKIAAQMSGTSFGSASYSIPYVGGVVSAASSVMPDIFNLPMSGSSTFNPMLIPGLGGLISSSGTATGGSQRSGLNNFFGGLLGLATGANVFKAITGGDYSVQMGPGQATTASSLGLTSAAGRAGTIIGAGGAALMGIEGAIQGFSAGGGRGVAAGIGSIAGAAAALDPEPISKAILGGVALAAGVVTAIFGDPKQQRQNAINDYIDRNQNALPDAIERDLDISGNNVVYQSNGRVRAAAPTIHINVTTMDSKSFIDHADDIANAAHAALMQNPSHKLLEPIRQEFAH